MTDAVTSVSAALPSRDPASRSAAAPAAGAAQTPAAETAPAPRARQPLTVDVQRDRGVFVYTLRDPATDRVLAVIPREAVRADRDGRHHDERV